MAVSKDLVAKRLKQARLALDISQKQLGIAAGIDEFSASARMNQYETGKHIPDILTLNQIARVLKLPIAYFYAEDDNLARLISIFGKLNKKEQLLLIAKLDRIMLK